LICVNNARRAKAAKDFILHRSVDGRTSTCLLFDSLLFIGLRHEQTGSPARSWLAPDVWAGRLTLVQFDNTEDDLRDFGIVRGVGGSADRGLTTVAGVDVDHHEVEISPVTTPPALRRHISTLAFKREDIPRSVQRSRTAVPAA
jgi:hypothetical protein